MKTRKVVALISVAITIINIFLYINFPRVIKATGNTTSIGTNLELQALLKAHNDIRLSLGLPLFKNEFKLDLSSKLKGEYMLENNCWSHYCDGIEPWHFFEEAGYNYNYAGENLAEGYFNIDDVMKAWVNSPTHYENIINPNFKDVGFSILHGTFQGSENNEIIVVHFGSL